MTDPHHSLGLILAERSDERAIPLLAASALSGNIHWCYESIAALSRNGALTGGGSFRKAALETAAKTPPSWRAEVYRNMLKNGYPEAFGPALERILDDDLYFLTFETLISALYKADREKASAGLHGILPKIVDEQKSACLLNKMAENLDARAIQMLTERSGT